MAFDPLKGQSSEEGSLEIKAIPEMVDITSVISADSLGTCMLFREYGERAHYIHTVAFGFVKVSVSLAGKELMYECETTKKLCMTRVVLKKKSADGSAIDVIDQEPMEAQIGRDSQSLGT